MNEGSVRRLVRDLLDKGKREHALTELSKIRESVPDIGNILWNEPGVPLVLLCEILSTYSMIDPPTLSSQASTRVCNALTLLQCIAANEATKGEFIAAQFPLYIYPLLNANAKSKPFEFLRLTSLGVIGALVKSESPEVVDFLLGTEVLPLCLKIMESGNDLSKTVAIFIVQKILIDNNGLAYICQNDQRMLAILEHLDLIVSQNAEAGSSRMVKHAVRCYLRLTEDARALRMLKARYPRELFVESTFDKVKDDPLSTKFIQEIKARIN